MTTGAAATSRSARKYTAAATRNNITPTKNIRRPSRSRSRRVRHHYRERRWESGLCAPYQVQLDEGFQGLVSENDEGLIYASEDNDKSIRAAAPESSDEPVAAPNTSDDDGAATVGA